MLLCFLSEPLTCTNNSLVDLQSLQAIPSTSTDSGEVDNIKEICPDLSEIEITMALVASNGDANQAVERLLGNCFLPFGFVIFLL